MAIAEIIILCNDDAMTPCSRASRSSQAAYLRSNPHHAVFFMVQSVQSGVWTGPGLQHAVQSAWPTWTDQSSRERGLDGLQATQAPELHTSKL
jgi:hypothetical protein